MKATMNHAKKMIRRIFKETKNVKTTKEQRAARKAANDALFFMDGVQTARRDEAEKVVTDAYDSLKRAFEKDSK